MTVKGRITQKVIADRLGIHNTTVSMALRDVPLISEDVRNRVKKLAHELGYRPNLAAKQLHGGASHLIGVIIDTCVTETGRMTLMTVEREIAKYGYRLLVGYMHDDLSRIQEYVDDFSGRGVDGVISMAHTYPEFGDKIPRLFSSFKNCVFIEEPLVEAPFSVVELDQEHGGYLMTRHLLELGHRRIAFTLSTSRYKATLDREAGYLRAHRELNVPVDEGLLWKGGISMIDTPEATNQFLEEILPHRPDAIITGGDDTAIWVISELNRRGIRVPQDCAVTSFNYIHYCRGFQPQLTTIDVQVEELAMKAIHLLLDDIKMGRDHQPVKQSVRIKPKLIVGQSCGSGIL